MTPPFESKFRQSLLYFKFVTVGVKGEERNNLQPIADVFMLQCHLQPVIVVDLFGGKGK